MFFSKKPVPQTHVDSPRPLPALGSSLNFPTYRSAEPLSAEDVEERLDGYVPSAIDKSKERSIEYYQNLCGPRSSHHDIKKMSYDVGILHVELSLVDHITYTKKFIGSGPDPDRYGKDPAMPGVLVISRESFTGFEPPFMKVQFANRMYEQWLKESRERGYFRIEYLTPALYVFDESQGPVNCLKELDVPVKNVEHITLYKKSNVVTWKELTI